MKALSLLLSLLAVATLAWTDWTGQNELSNAEKKMIAAEQLRGPVSLPEEPLTLEQEWQAKVRQVEEKRQAQTKPKQKNPALSGQRLIIGDKEFALQGIFYRGNMPFVLLKSSNGKLLSVKQGDTVEQDVTLSAVSANSITLSTPDITKEFKLFQRQSNEKTN